MATVKKGILTSPPIWARHLRPWGKRLFWKMERKEAGRDAQERVAETAAIRAIEAESIGGDGA